jgi:hypothetical protein
METYVSQWLGGHVLPRARRVCGSVCMLLWVKTCSKGLCWEVYQCTETLRVCELELVSLMVGV